MTDQGFQDNTGAVDNTDPATPETVAPAQEPAEASPDAEATDAPPAPEPAEPAPVAPAGDHVTSILARLRALVDDITREQEG